MATITNVCSAFDKSNMRSVRSVPKVDYSWMDVEPDNVLVDPDYEETVDEENDDDEETVGQSGYAGMEFTTEDAPVVYRKVRGWDRERMCVIWRTIQQTVLDDSDSDYCPSDDDNDEE